MHRPEIKLAFLLTFVILGGILLLTSAKPQQGEAILSVPYNGIYTYDPRVGSAAAAVYSVLQYWQKYDITLPVRPLGVLEKQLVSLENLNLEFPITQLSRFWDLKVYLENIGYSADIVRLSTLKSIASFLENERTPLIYFQRPAPTYRGNYVPYRIVIGTSLSKNTLIVNDVLFGPAYSLSFDEFRASYYKELPENLKFRFLAIRPKNYKDLLPKEAIGIYDYPNRREYDKFENVILNWQEARDWVLTPAEKISLWEKVLSDPLFPEMSPAMRLYAFTGLSENYRALNKFALAQEFAEKAIALNVDLYGPWGVWSSFRAKEIARPWVRLGQAYMAMDEREKALQAFQTALHIEPDHPDIAETNEALARLLPAAAPKK